jgi:2-oxoglutarate dehydrogenase E2 component (dihydrolipoamide succinyltransferase)
MAQEIIVPPFGESIAESTISAWLKPDGSTVRKGENIVTLDTEKASSDLQAEASGILRIVIPAGKDVAIGSVIGRIEESSEASTKAAAPAAEPAPAAPAPVPAAAVAAPAAPAPIAPQPAAPAPQPTNASIVNSPGLFSAVPTPARGLSLAPAVAALAQSRVGQSFFPPTPQAAPSAAPSPSLPPDPFGRPETREQMTRLRRTIAAHLLKAKQETAMLTTFNEVDMSAVMALRSRYQELFVKKHGIKLGFMSFFVKAVITALKKFPLLNASIDGNDIIHHHFYDVAVAISTDRGLVVPPIRNADQLDYAGIEKEIARLAALGRDGKLTTDDLKGGTFTITNGGTFGSLLSTPLLNPPQVGILGMHNITQRPVVLPDGTIAARPIMMLALSYDHRLIDGREAVQFLVSIRDQIQDPERIILDL